MFKKQFIMLKKWVDKMSVVYLYGWVWYSL